MPTFALPCVPTDSPLVSAGDGASLAKFLLPLNDPAIQAFLGQERWREQDGWTNTLWVSEGEKFRQAGGWQQGRRYLWVVDGQAVGALNVSLQGQPRQKLSAATAVVANIFVAPSHRRQGIASTLLARALKDFASLAHDTALTAYGAALFGVPTSLTPPPDAPLFAGLDEAKALWHVTPSEPVERHPIVRRSTIA